MSRSVLASLALGLLLATQALAQPTVTMPREGAMLTPNYDIIGSMPQQSFLVVLTDVIRCDTNQCIGTVPGIRHWTSSDGSFHFRVAAPRVAFGDPNLPVRYQVRVFEASPDSNGPETQIATNCVSPESIAWGIGGAGRPTAIPASFGETNATGGEMGEMGGGEMATPTLAEPTAQAALGPNYEVAGSLPHRGFVVVETDVINSQNGELISTVPGIRHWSNEDGSFRFRVAAPRVAIGGQAVPVSYRVRVYEAGPGVKGPEATVEATMAQ